MGLQKGAADKHAARFSVDAIYILRLGEGGLGRGAERCLPAGSPCHFSDALGLPRPGLSDWLEDRHPGGFLAGGWPGLVARI